MLAHVTDSSSANSALAETELLVARLGIRGTLDVLIEYAERLIETIPSSDRLAQFRAASDHRNLVNLRDKVHN